MTDESSSLDNYFDRLTNEDREQLTERMERYGEQLRDQGFEVALAEAENQFFAGVLVIDDENGRFGFLEADGSVSWIDGGRVGGIGALGSAVAQNPTDALETTVEGLENADVE
ncbi:hypothetical protein ACFQJD_15935 [Haloplanus sp. GCM10025708]|uniref:hypothetical protein n=1 Tax=Haloferacaceae TaxID=1644056 RepID=UPI0036159EF8